MGGNEIEVGDRVLISVGMLYPREAVVQKVEGQRYRIKYIEGGLEEEINRDMIEYWNKSNLNDK